MGLGEWYQACTPGPMGGPQRGVGPTATGGGAWRLKQAVGKEEAALRGAEHLAPSKGTERRWKLLSPTRRHHQCKRPGADPE